MKDQMEARAAFAGASGENGTSDNLEILADWATYWRRKVYGLGSFADASIADGQNLKK
jgi:hypothetical protein